MANSRVVHAARTANLRNGSSKSSLIPITVSLDTAADFTVYTPVNADAYVAVLGFLFADATASNLTIKSGSTTLVTLELAANTGLYQPVNGDIMLETAIGEALVFNASATMSSILVHVMEISQVSLNA